MYSKGECMSRVGGDSFKIMILLIKRWERAGSAGLQQKDEEKGNNPT